MFVFLSTKDRRTSIDTAPLAVDTLSGADSSTLLFTCGSFNPKSQTTWKHHITYRHVELLQRGRPRGQVCSRAGLVEAVGERCPVEAVEALPLVASSSSCEASCSPCTCPIFCPWGSRFRTGLSGLLPFLLLLPLIFISFFGTFQTSELKKGPSRTLFATPHAARDGTRSGQARESPRLLVDSPAVRAVGHRLGRTHLHHCP